MPTAQSAVRQPRRLPSRGRHAQIDVLVGGGVTPDLPPGFVRRPSLVRRLIEAHDASIALIVAPPGYGKSSLLLEWAERDERPFVWLENAEREPVAAARLVRAVRSQHPRFVLVLDDAHTLAPALQRKLIEAAVRELPEGAIIAVASRSDPALPIGSLRAHRALVEVGPDELAMTVAEAAALTRSAGLELDFEEMQALVRRTEGWPAALYLAALSLRSGLGDAEGLEAYGGDDHRLTEYLRDEVLSALPADEVSFLTRSSVLDRLSGPICDAVMDARGSARGLDRMARLSRLLVPLDLAHHTYRWQGLFRETLRAELRMLDPSVEQELHERASVWYQREGDVERALNHAVAAGDPRRTAELLWPRIPTYTADGRGELISGWLGRFSEETIASSAPLALCAAHGSLATGSVAEAKHWAVIAKAALNRTGRRTNASRSLEPGIAVLEAMIAKDGAISMRQQATRAYEREPDDSPWRPILCLLAGTAKHLTGDHAGAEPLLGEGAELGTLTAPSVSALCFAQRVMIAIERQDWEAASQFAEQAEHVIEQRALAGCPSSALVYAAAAAAYAHQGRVDEAKRALRSGITLLASLGEFVAWFGAEARILLAHASLWLADVVGARTLLAEASRLARRMADAIIFQRWFDNAWEYLDTVAETSLAGPSSLTIAELRVLRFMPSHRSFREIALQLGVSANTVKTQAHAVYRKLGVTSRSEAVARAGEAGLLGQ